jgi:hypothetical protein
MSIAININKFRLKNCLNKGLSFRSIYYFECFLEVKTRGCYVPIKVSCATVFSLNEVYRCFDANAVNITADVNTLADVLSRELNDSYNIQISADIGTNRHLLLGEICAFYLYP